MVSPEVVHRRMRLLEGYLKKLRAIRARITLDSFLKDSDTQDIVERNLHLAIESLLDIGQHIIASAGWPPAEEYASIFTILRQHGVLSKDLFARVQGMAGFRNLLVHGYAEIDHFQVFQVLQDHLDDLADLAQAYRQFVDGESSR